MSDLHSLYEDIPGGCHELCKGCTVSKMPKADHGIVDYESVQPVDILFLTDSFVVRQGRFHALRADSQRVVDRFMQGLTQEVTYAFSPSIKCPSTKDGDLKPADKKLCREHLAETVRAYAPKLIICLGNTPMVMLVKKSGITNKRGVIFKYELDGTEYPVAPTLHPFQVTKEPSNRALFEQDVFNAIDRYVYGNVADFNFSYEYLDTEAKVEEMWETLKDTKEDVACDIETEGLDFRNHKMLTIAFSTDDNNWVLPCFHKDSPYNDETMERILRTYIKDVLENQNNRKIFQNAKFDLKFLLKFDIDPYEVWDTKLMAHLWNENIPKGLMDLVKIWWPTELENF